MQLLSIFLMMDPQGKGGSSGTFLILLGLIILVIIVAVKTSKKENDIPSLSDQTNKVVNVTLAGGLIGLFSSSPLSSLNSRIVKENANGWKVIQVIPAESGNIFLYIFRLLLLVGTLFIYTTANGYYLIMEKKI